MNKLPFRQSFYDKLSRREFLQGFGISLAGLLLPGQITSKTKEFPPEDDAYGLLGRVTQSGYQLYDAPNTNAEVIETMKQDSLWRITGVTLSPDDHSPNRIWYELDGKGYAHSRKIQPVHRIFNDATTVVPVGGCLGEITVPFVDAYKNLDPDHTIAYRFYYAATFWVMKRLWDDGGTVWYQLLDDRSYQLYYVPAYYVRLVPDSELAPISPEVPSQEKKIVVDLASQALSAFEGDRLVYMSRISSGVRLTAGGFATPKGHYRTTRKRPCRHMLNPPNEYGSGFDLPGVPWVSYFTSNGIAFHGAYWHNDFGVPHSHGCINMTPQAAKWVYRWTTPTVPPENYYFADKDGTRVIIQ